MLVLQQHIGRSQVVDAAVLAVVAGSRAFTSRNDEDIAMAHERNIAALKFLRSSLSPKSHGLDRTGSLVATKLLCFAQVCVLLPKLSLIRDDLMVSVTSLRRIYRSTRAYPVVKLM